MKHRLHQPLGLGDRPLRELVADAARPGVQDQPDDVALVQADLDEVVARAERPELREGRGRCRSVSSVAGARSRPVPPAGRTRPCRRDPSGAGRDASLDQRHQPAQAVRQVGRREVGLGGDHSAADVDADRVRDDRARRRDDRSDGRPEAGVRVGISATCDGTQGSDAARAASSSTLSSTSLPHDSTFLRTMVGTPPPLLCLVLRLQGACYPQAVMRSLTPWRRRAGRAPQVEHVAVAALRLGAVHRPVRAASACRPLSPSVCTATPHE
jgi:hypothetical protein